MKIVKFNKPISFGDCGCSYSKGQAASFEDEIADTMIKRGYGEEISLESTKLTPDKK